MGQNIGKAWKKDVLCSASCDFEDDCRRRYPDIEGWDALPQLQYITAIYLALLADDVKRAEQLLDGPPYPLDAYVEHGNLLKGLIEYSKNEFTDREKREFIAAYDVFFDKLRNPRSKKEHGVAANPLAQIEFALLREKVIRNPKRDIDWRRTIDEYSK